MLLFVGNIKFSEPGDEDIFAGFKCCFDDVQNYIGKFDGFDFGVSAMIVQTIYDVRFGKCHDGSPIELKMWKGQRSKLNNKIKKIKAHNFYNSQDA